MIFFLRKFKTNEIASTTSEVRAATSAYHHHGMPFKNIPGTLLGAGISVSKPAVLFVIGEFKLEI
jgi:hypothetical protein